MSVAPHLKHTQGSISFSGTVAFLLAQIAPLKACAEGRLLNTFFPHAAEGRMRVADHSFCVDERISDFDLN